MRKFFLFIAALCCMVMMSLNARAQVMQVDKGRVIEVINLSQLRAALEDGDVIYEGKKSTLRKTDTVRIMKDITWKSRVLFFSAATCGTLNLDLNGHTLRRTLYDNHEYFQCALTIAADFFPYDVLVIQWAEDHSHDDQYEYKLNEHYGKNVLDVKVNIYDSKGNGKIICDNTIPDDKVRKRNNCAAVLINESPQDHFHNSYYGDNLFSQAEYIKYLYKIDYDINDYASFIEFNLYGGSLIGQMNGEEFYQQNLTSSQVNDYRDFNGIYKANYGLYSDSDFGYKKNDPSTTVNVYGGYMTRLFTDNYLNLNMYGGQLGGEKTMNEYLPALIMGERAEFLPWGFGLFAHFTDGILYGMTIFAQHCYEEGNPTWTEWITDTDLEVGVSFGQGTRPMIDGEILTLDEWMDKICKHDKSEYNYKVEFVRDYSRVEIDGLVYKMDPANLTAVVIADKEEDESNYASLPSKVYVPATVNCVNKTFKVTGIADNAFYTCAAIQEIVLPESLVSVGDAAFYSCANLQRVSLPSSIRRIGKWAFFDCKELTEITIPQGVTAILENTFNGCVKLEKVNLPTSLNTIGNAAFRGCAISKLILPESVSSLGSGAFSACNNLHWVYNRRVTPQNISGKNVFGGITVSGIKLYVPFGCGEDYNAADTWKDFDIEEEHPKYGNLYYILDPNTLTAEVTYSSSTNENYNTLSGKVVVPATITVDENEYQVTKIGTQAFAYNSTIEEIELPEGIEEIAAGAFSEAVALTKLNIPESVKAIPYSILYGSGIYNNDANYTNKCLYIDGCLLAAKNDISGFVNVKNGTRIIAGSAFAGHTEITGINFPIALRYIGENAFNNCNKLAELIIPEGVKEISHGAFTSCSMLDNVVLPLSLEKIGNYAFRDCFNLKRIVIPANVQTIGKSAFDGSGVSQLEEVTLPAGIREIEEGAFGNQAELKTISLYAPDPSSITLGENVFTLVEKEYCTLKVPYGSKALYSAADEWKDFKIEEMNPCIGGLYYSFNDEDLTARVVCDQCNTNANYATLTGNVTIPASVIWNEKEYTVTAVSPNAFSYSQHITSLTFPNTIDKIQYNTAESCPALLRVILPSSIKKIEEYAFADCHKLYEINLPDGLEEIEERAFAGCYDMTTIRIPSTLKTIGNYIFESCSDILEIYNFSETPQDIKDKNVFIDADPSMVTLYIPKGTESDYMAAEVWQDFLIEEYKTVLSVTSEDENKGTVDGSGEYTRETIVEINATPEEGYVFDGWDDGEMQNPRKLLLDMDNMEFVAYFTAKTFLVTFLGWEDKVLSSSLVPYNSDAPTPEEVEVPEGYEFQGWDNAPTNITEDMVIKAVIEKKVFEVNFVGFNNADLGTQTVKWDEAAVAPEAPVVEGYHFVKWDKEFDHVKADMTVTAVYAINIYTVVFNDKDDKEVWKQDVEHGKAVTPPDAPEVEGYHFTGWDPETDFSSITGNVTVKATYAINTYTVKFYDHSDNVISTQTVNWNEAAVEPELEAWAGHTFTSWSAEFDHVKSDLDIKPIYDVETYKVTFVGFDGETSLKVENVQYGQGATAPEAPAVEGYTFTGWDKEFDNIIGDLTVKAVYERNYYKLTLVAEHGSIAITDESAEHSLNPDNIEHGTKVRLAATPDEGYQFKEWSTGEKTDVIFITVTANKTVTATFEEKPDLTPQNLNAELTEKDGDTEITLSWDKVAGVPSYEVKLTVGEKELGAKNTFGKNSVTELLSAVVKEYSIKPGTYLVSWAVRSTDIMGTAVSDWAEGIAFQITVKDTGTGVDQVEQPSLVGQKVLRDGKLFIIVGGKTFDATGQLVR